MGRASTRRSWEAFEPVRNGVVIATKFGFRNGVPSEGLDSRPERIENARDGVRAH